MALLEFVFEARFSSGKSSFLFMDGLTQTEAEERLRRYWKGYGLMELKLVLSGTEAWSSFPGFLDTSA